MTIEHRASLMMASLDIAALDLRDVLRCKQLMAIFGDVQGKECSQHYPYKCTGNLLAFFNWMRADDKLKLVMDILDGYKI